MTTETQSPTSLPEAGKHLAQDLDALKIHKLLPEIEGLAYRLQTPIPNTDLLAWLSDQDNVTKIYWENRDKSFALAGIGIADNVAIKNAQDRGKAIGHIKKALGQNNLHQQYYGGFSFDYRFSPRAEWQNWDIGRFVLPLIEVRQDRNGCILACNILLNHNFEKSKQILLKALRSLEYPTVTYAPELVKPRRRVNIPDESSWKAAAGQVITGIAEKKYQKIVLGRSVRLDFDEKINPFYLMSRLNQSASNCYSFIVQFSADEYFIGASPERLFYRRGSRIETEALAGTRPAGENHNLDEILRNELLSSVKDKNEQMIVADMIKAGLSKLCQNYNSDPELGLLNWSGGHHLISRFEGKLKKVYDDKDLIANLHPTPAVAGTPTLRAMREISQIESFERGWYCGPVGYIGSDQSEFAVAIRSGLLKNRTLYLYAGAGIVKGSLPAEEWAETENKLMNFLRIFDAASK